MENLIKKHADKIRFILVGGTNTVIDFVILFSLFNLVGLPVFYSNVISTSVALTFSFFANKTFTFKDGGGITKKKMATFLFITLVGLWLIQPVIILVVRSIFGTIITNDNILLLTGKLIATCVTLVWNYILYRKFVFKTQK